ncbi:Nif3-like dinuclear metal center hexameric protein [Planomicrobium sp. CPCC 101079]|uniref:Nif3-like dinuclear metal center hexameric protein n=1 Tax=Planomicrobium sp. CPCC 101079 TaxID=2599618 RepID=UPI0011B70E7B|nr:Nif3-like dinuclear metal center hexameric protein [Planomicrobium sp. CPCC 101079]TWT09381.1 Nif3-like dinuclear metal center hexameric protein [Planomicrobium sp. CPCC 101079]
MKIPNGQQIIEEFEKWSPKYLAMEGDPVGLHVGTLNKKVERVLVTLDVNEKVVDEAIAKRAGLIIAHHPPIYRPLKSLQTDFPQGRLMEKLIKHDIAVYAAHTNLDVATGGVNDLLAEALGLKDTKVLVPTYEAELVKIAVFVPESHEEQVRDALGKAGAGAIGDYEHCSYTLSGTGRFRPTAGADPFIGEPGKMETTAESKIEVVIRKKEKDRAIKAMIAAHPYEEVAYDVFTLENKEVAMGLGRVGNLETATSLADFTELVKKRLEVPAVRVVGELEKQIKKVAVLGGDGNKYIQAAKRSGADVYVTGDLYFHVAQDAEAMGLAVVDPGHHVEKVMIRGVVNHMAKTTEWQCEFIASEVDTEPFQFK